MARVRREAAELAEWAEAWALWPAKGRGRAYGRITNRRVLVRPGPQQIDI